MLQDNIFDFVWKVLRPYNDIWEFGILLTENFKGVLLSWRFLRGCVCHYTRATIVAHIPWISHSFHQRTQDNPQLMQMASLLPRSPKASVDTTSRVKNTEPSVNFKSSLSWWLQINALKISHHSQRSNHEISSLHSNSTPQTPLGWIRKNHPSRSYQQPHPHDISVESSYSNRRTFLQLRDGQEFVTNGQETIFDYQLPCLCYDNISNTVIFNDALKVWRAKSQTD